MNRVCTLFTLASLSALSACSVNRYCERPQPYDTAASIPPLVGTENLKIPSSTTALKVPEAHGDSLTFGYLAPNPEKPGKNKVECLDRPPPIPPIVNTPK